MLVLTVKPGHSVRIGEATVHVQRIDPDEGVRMGISAPREIDIIRDDAKVKYRKPKGDRCN